MQVGDHIEVRNQGPQLGARTQVEFGSGVDIERLVEVVGLDAQLVAERCLLVERDAVVDAGRVAAVEQAVLHETGAAQVIRIGKTTKKGRDSVLRLGIERRAYRQVEAVEGIKIVYTDEFAERSPDIVDRLALDKGNGFAIAHAPCRNQARVQRGIAQHGGYGAVAGQQTQITVGQVIQALSRLEQQTRRAALRDDQRQYLPEYLRAGVQIGFGVGQQAIGAGEVTAIPSPQPVAQTVHLTVSGQSGQGGRS